MININPLGLDGVLEITPRKFGDARGFFSETYNKSSFTEAGIDLEFVQDNHSYSAAKGVLRGLHYQLSPRAQDKLVRVVRGSILDVAVDIRRESPDFGKWVSLVVSAEKWNQILVPKGFAHGFVTLEDDTEVVYKVTDVYSPEHDRSIRYDDPAIGIEWPIAATEIQLSDKDRNAPLLSAAEVFG
ncbi:dTDP-4-dehydrorhamnose 3,5-epimerase [Paramesorhizobium deserti]|uniref:dTDP-4-dehydrorhamnose 3,5-epimerase n=1 Tax=Paramesorhizobium deserti TaxID=1494590 RepID=A0A135HTQ6_9HYPH|nr:dTDP-4-dehydrorhamnose 3,5-epimerase [Paramesorhizobium deserti]KXF76579.1 dTDP-4-dehydrorhamnose 3,5-epimerase [Paramesorhizobium deserti]